MKRLMTLGILSLTAVSFAEQPVLKATPFQILKPAGGLFSAKAGDKPGTVTVGFSIGYGNSCTVAQHRPTPLVVFEYEDARDLVAKLIIQDKPGARIMCPAVYQPVSIPYTVEIDQLYSGQKVKVQVEGAKGVVEVTVP